jgi:mannose/cellobiose epimerase-like protein (N-acyl-D-glucosamine 2-epimerase family)
MAAAFPAPNLIDFRAALVDAIAPFWERSIDREYGGYWVDLDQSGRREGRGDKHIITTAR